MPRFKSELNEIEGVYQFKIDVPFDVKFVCIYLLKVDGKNVLFDAGFNTGNWSRLFFSLLEEINLSIKDIDYCFISHEHLDHIGLIKRFKKKNPDIKILMGDITHELVKWEADPEKLTEVENAAKDIAKMLMKFGMSEKQGNAIVKFATFWPKLRVYQKPDVLLQDNDEVSIGTNKLKAIWTPGHSLGHICVFDRSNKFLFSGDHILSKITPHVGNFLIKPSLREKYNNLGNILDHYLKSLDRIDKLNPRIIFPAHQEIIHNPHERILEIKEHHKNRLKEISTMIKDKPMTPLKIANIHFGELDQLNTFLAISEIITHLIYLEHQERVERIEKSGKILFKSI